MTPLLLILAAQAKKPVHPVRTPTLSVAQEASPVSALEARAAFARWIALCGKVADVNLGVPSIPAVGRPVRRAEVIVEMQRLYRAAEPAIRFTPAEIRFDASKLSIDSPNKPALLRLVARGFIGPVSPLATSPLSSLSIRQFGDALGFFGARLAQVSHLPSPLWTPMLKVD